MICGGFSEGEFKDVPENVQAAFAEETKAFKDVKIIALKKQVVAGVNYKISFNCDGKVGVMTFWAKLDKTVQCTNTEWE